MSNVTLVIIIVVAVMIVAALVAFFVSRGRRAQQERQERAREQFGPEYERWASSTPAFVRNSRAKSRNR